MIMQGGIAVDSNNSKKLQIIGGTYNKLKYCGFFEAIENTMGEIDPNCYLPTFVNFKKLTP